MNNIIDETTGYYTNQRKEMLEFISSSSRKILDIGCSEGNFGILIKNKLNAEVWGIELVEKAASVASRKLDQVIQGDFLEKCGDLPGNYFDCVIFNDALEHFPDPWLVLGKLKRLLAENGSVVASIPNVRYIGNLVELIFKKDWEYKDGGGILDISHFRFFTKKSIIRMFEQSGYTINRIQGINATPSWKVKLLSALSFGHFSDVRYLEFAVVANLKK
ncbi:MAG: class I SAM-dependent methyltransferase [Bacteroidota bacterium]|nr:class I SAM-dependent methyltransferase [Bacteroidota bacterium]